MGIHCEINLHKPADGVFVTGGVVTGVIKYAIDEESTFNKIIVSLKGKGHLRMTRKIKNKTTSYTQWEDYVDINDIIKNDDEDQKVPIGSYEIPFKFRLPRKIPPSFRYHGFVPRYRVRCNIVYYVRIKFERPGILQFTKRFKKEIPVISNIEQKYPNEPTVFGEKKTLTQLFTSKKRIVDVKATIQKRVFKPGEHLELSYEVANNTNVIIKGVVTELFEEYKFTSRGGHKAGDSKTVKDTDSKTGAIKSGDTKNMDVTVILPSDITSLDYSKLVSRDYYVRIEVILPMPHRNLKVIMPIQIGDESEHVSNFSYEDPPPSYWEVMGEQTKDDDDDDKKIDMV